MKSSAYGTESASILSKFEPTTIFNPHGPIGTYCKEN